VNSGIIATLFAAATIWVVFIFRIRYNEALQMQHYIGIVLLILSVVIIGIGGA
jgi:drug/metabolite transporter (DMT)-like permease